MSFGLGVKCGESREKRVPASDGPDLPEAQRTDTSQTVASTHRSTVARQRLKSRDTHIHSNARMAALELYHIFIAYIRSWSVGRMPGEPLVSVAVDVS